MYASGQKNRHIDKLVKTLRLPGYLEIEHATTIHLRTGTTHHVGSAIV